MTWRQQKLCATFGGISTMINTIHTSWLPPLHHMILCSANLVVPAAVRHSIDNLDGLFLCTAVYVSQPQEAHTHFWYRLPSWERRQQHQFWVQTRLSVPASFRSRRMAPRFCAWRREREGGGCVQGVCWRSPTQHFVEGSHLLCPLPAFHTASVPDWSTTPEPTTTSSLPPHTHTHTLSCMFVASYAKEFFTWVFLNSAFFNTLLSIWSMQTEGEKNHSYIFLLLLSFFLHSETFLRN